MTSPPLPSLTADPKGGIGQEWGWEWAALMGLKGEGKGKGKDVGEQCSAPWPPALTIFNKPKREGYSLLLAFFVCSLLFF